MHFNQFNKCLLSIYNVIESILGNEDFTGTNIDKNMLPWNVCFSESGQRTKCINNSDKFYGGIFIKEGGMVKLVNTMITEKIFPKVTFNQRFKRCIGRHSADS